MGVSVKLTGVDGGFCGLGGFEVDEAKRFVVKANKAINLCAMRTWSESSQRARVGRKFLRHTSDQKRTACQKKEHTSMQPTIPRI